MFYVFHGPDTFSRGEKLAELKKQMGDPAMADLNTTTLDGRTVPLSELQHACNTVPFLFDRRLVVVRNLLTRLAGSKKEEDKEYLSALEGYLPSVPETTRLIFLEDTRLPKNNRLLKLAERDERGVVMHFEMPPKGQLGRWVAARARKKKAQIDPDAAEALAVAIGDDLHALDLELDKLATYAGGERPISAADVSLLVTAAGESDVFALVDAVGQRNGKRALLLLHNLLEANEAPVYLLAMIVRQFRILIQVKELSGRGMNKAQIAAEANMHPFVAEKGLKQARNFSMEQLEQIYDRLLQTDLEIKTGRTESILALDMLVSTLCR